jgi:hypothetical protein
VALFVPAAVERGIRDAFPAHLLRPEGDLAQPSNEPMTCLNCGAEIAEDDAACKKCGWTYAPADA